MLFFAFPNSFKIEEFNRSFKGNWKIKFNFLFFIFEFRIMKFILKMY